jgi:hypothetical protein
MIMKHINSEDGGFSKIISAEYRLLFKPCEIRDSPSAVGIFLKQPDDVVEKFLQAKDSIVSSPSFLPLCSVKASPKHNEMSAGEAQNPISASNFLSKNTCH